MLGLYDIEVQLSDTRKVCQTHDLAMEVPKTKFHAVKYELARIQKIKKENGDKLAGLTFQYHKLQQASQVQIITRAGHAMLGRCGPHQRLKQRQPLCANLPDQVAYDRCQLHHIANNLVVLLAPLYMIMSSLQKCTPHNKFTAF